MSDDFTGGPAFPGFEYTGDYGSVKLVFGPDGQRYVESYAPGMTYRAWAAAKILAGMLSADGNGPRWSPAGTGSDFQPGRGKWLDPDGVARQAVEIADALILRLKQSPEEIVKTE